MTTPLRDDKTPAPPLKRQPPTGNNAAWDADDDERPDGDPASVKNEGPLESLGKAISSPLLESEEDSSRSDPKSPATKR